MGFSPPNSRFLNMFSTSQQRPFSRIQGPTYPYHARRGTLSPNNIDIPVIAGLDSRHRQTNCPKYPSSPFMGSHYQSKPATSPHDQTSFRDAQHRTSQHIHNYFEQLLFAVLCITPTLLGFRRIFLLKNCITTRLYVGEIHGRSGLERISSVSVQSSTAKG
jgi:hypothetical protein